MSWRSPAGLNDDILVLWIADGKVSVAEKEGQRVGTVLLGGQQHVVALQTHHSFVLGLHPEEVGELDVADFRVKGTELLK